MRVLDETVSFDDVLTAWGLHEGRGLFGGEAERAAPGLLSGPDDDPMVRAFAQSIAEQMRSPLVNPLREAGIQRVMRVVVEANDRSQILVLTNPTTPAPTLSQRAADLQDHPHVTGLRRQTQPIGSQLVAVAREPGLPFLLLDGVHRGAAWWWRCEDGQGDALTVAVVLTTKRCWFEGPES